MQLVLNDEFGYTVPIILPLHGGSFIIDKTHIQYLYMSTLVTILFSEDCSIKHNKKNKP